MDTKKIIKIAVIAVLVLALAYGGLWLYWGRRHSVLYDVKTVTVTQSAEDENIYNISYDITAKNWFLDFSPHTYKLKAYLPSGYGMYYFEGETEYFKTSMKPTRLTIDVKFDMASVFDRGAYSPEDSEFFDEIISVSHFVAYDKSGKKVESANLYMLDNSDAEIIFAN
ncbi:MAG: hypothetical protein IJL87_03080 [Clostridia bacterium]|nr:hypothetical protein [Clostridia bacterium]